MKSKRVRLSAAMALNSSLVAPRKDGQKNKPGQGRPQKAAAAKVIRKNVSLYAEEWAKIQKEGEGPTEAIRRLLRDSV